MWSGLEEWLAEYAEVDLGSDGLRARGVQLGVTPEPYHATYELVAEGNWITRSLVVEASGNGWSRRIELTSDGDGRWSYAQQHGDPSEVEGALDCDLQWSPLTNLMPVRRYRLHKEPGTVDFSMAWLSVPELRVTRSEQRYEHVRDAVVRFSSGDFEADLELDSDGLVVVYPRLARRMADA
jgi:uncharacterized protein